MAVQIESFGAGKAPALSVVADNTSNGLDALAQAAGVSARVRQLQQEARMLAREHVKALEHALFQVEQLSAEIADGGEAYPAGVRDIARRLAEDCGVKVQAIEAIASRR